MPKLPRISGSEAKRAFEEAGYELVRTSGSHHIMKKAGFPHLSIPIHGKKILGKGLLNHLITAAGMTVDEFAIHLKK